MLCHLTGKERPYALRWGFASLRRVVFIRLSSQIIKVCKSDDDRQFEASAGLTSGALFDFPRDREGNREERAPVDLRREQKNEVNQGDRTTPEELSLKEENSLVSRHDRQCRTHRVAPALGINLLLCGFFGGARPTELGARAQQYVV